MLEFDPVTFGPLDGGEAGMLAGLARIDTSFQGLMRTAVRAQFLRAVTGPSLGAAAERGLEVAEACAMLMLAAHPPSDEAEFRAKAIVLRRHSSGDDGAGAGAWVRAALERDRRRLCRQARVVPRLEGSL